MGGNSSFVLRAYYSRLNRSYRREGRAGRVRESVGQRLRERRSRWSTAGRPPTVAIAWARFWPRGCVDRELSCSFRHRPIFKLQPRYTGELALVCRHEEGVAPARLCGDEKIIGANGRSGPLQRGANVARLLGVRGLERQNLDRASEKVGIIITVHLVALVLSFFVFSEEKWIFLVSEVFIIISIYISWKIYQQSIKPLQLLVQGADAIVDRDFNVRFVETGSYEMDKLITVYNNMMDELRIERTRQQEQHYFLEKLIHTSPTGIMVLNYDGLIEQVNPRGVELIGLAAEHLLDKQIADLDHPLMNKLAAMQSGDSATVTMAAATYKVHKSHFVDRGFPRHFVMIEVLTAEILEAEKNAYGKVIRMMAHEVNNTIGPVNSIMSSAINKLSALQAETPLREALQIAVERNSNLNMFMRNFADLVRLPPPRKEQFDLASTVLAVARLMESRAGEKRIDFICQIPPAPFLVFGDKQQLEQVLINVIKNAIESIDGSGSIAFELDKQSRVLTIADTGKGIDNHLAQNLFKPFFSTKKDGQGIGLTLIREVLYNHNFLFTLKTVSQPQKRTEFRIQF